MNNSRQIHGQRRRIVGRTFRIIELFSPFKVIMKITILDFELFGYSIEKYKVYDGRRILNEKLLDKLKLNYIRYHD